MKDKAADDSSVTESHGDEPVAAGAVPAVVCEPAPDWSNIEGEFPCPLCRYNLRGLNVPRCPECGYRFEWKEILDPNRREHPYLFEHHPERNFWSFRKTARGALRPTRFWTSLHPVMPSRPGRLLAYYVIAAILFLAAAVPLLYAPDIIGYAWMTAQGSPMPFSPFGRQVSVSRWLPLAAAGTGPYSSIWRFLAGLAGVVWGAEEVLWMLFGTLTAWPLLTLGSLMVFRWSMARAKVRPVHVVRCVVYSFDMIPAALLALLTLLLLAGYVLSGTWSGWFEPILLLLWAATIAFCCRRLQLAYAYYLQFDRPFLTILASQIMVSLAALNVPLFMIRPFWRPFTNLWLRELLDFLVFK